MDLQEGHRVAIGVRTNLQGRRAFRVCPALLSTPWRLHIGYAYLSNTTLESFPFRKIHRLRFLPLLLSWLYLLPIQAPARSEADISPESAWKKTGDFLYHEAADEFGDLLDEHRGNVIQLKFGLALNLINKQPKTQANLERARGLFSEVYSSEGMDGLGVAARYYVGRIWEVHQLDADLAEAERIYGEIIAAHPHHFYAQLAATRYALIRFYTVASREERMERFEELEPLAENLVRPGIRSQFHNLMGDLATRYELPLEKALYHYREAVAAGIQNFRIRRDVLVSVGEIARELGEVSIAVEFFERFLREFPRDKRNILIRERLTLLRPRLSNVP